MGKRELLIAAAFIAIAAIVYQFTAPAPKDGEEGFSLRRMFDGMRREMNERVHARGHDSRRPRDRDDSPLHVSLDSSHG